jgi:class 3 adenylate cyclase
MKRVLLVVALLAPAAVLVYLAARPGADLTVSVPIAHFYIVSFITCTAAVISILLAVALGPQAQPRHALAAAAFAVMGTLFFSHGLATPGALIDYAHPAIEWSAWLTMLGGGALFAAAGLDQGGRMPAWLPLRRVVYGAIAAVLVYSAVALFAPGWLTALSDTVDRPTAPWGRLTIFAMTLVLWLFAAYRLWRIWRTTHNRVDGVLAFVAPWLATATVSMHLFMIWSLSWWSYHVVLLVSFLITVWVLVGAYEQVRQFSLLRYYLAVSLIVTALLALAASALFTQFAYDTLVAEIRDASLNTARHLANGLMNDLRASMPSGDLRDLPDRSTLKALVDARLAGLPINSLLIYDPSGLAVYGSEPEWTGVKVDNRTAFAAALGGETLALIRPPDDRPVAYRPTSSVYAIQSFAPLYASADPGARPIGVLATVQEAPALNPALIDARRTGLLTAAVTMGLLFGALLVVVGRADRIIAARTTELATAYGELRMLSNRLKTYSEWLLGRNLLGQALANPETLGLMRRERTIVFADIRGFTRWSEDRSPEETVQLLNRYYAAIEGTLARHEAIKFKFSADETMVVFAGAAEAVAAARELRAMAGALLAAETLGLGIGLHTGPLVEGLLGSAEVKFYDVVGDTVNTAKRIESAAGPGEVLISDATRGALAGHLAIGPARAISAKGKEAPVTVYPLLNDVD